MSLFQHQASFVYAEMKVSMKGAAAIILLGAVLIAYSADCLSDAICDNVEAAWQSDEPRLEGQFPFYTLLGMQPEPHDLKPMQVLRTDFPSLFCCSLLHRQLEPRELQCGLLCQQWDRLWACSS